MVSASSSPSAMASQPQPRLLIVGLDCLAPELVFDRFRERLPTFSRLMEEGCYGPLRSCDPPITVPAWSCMFSGRDPGELGLYGFSHRQSWDLRDTSGALGLPDATCVPYPRLWELASQAGLNSVVVGVPQTWPPPSEAQGFRGALVSGILCPGRELPCTAPASLREQLPEDYAFDLEGFRGQPPDTVEASVKSMTRARFELFRALLQQQPWSLAVIVEIGVDRMHHVFWRDGMQRIQRYYEALDAQLARTLTQLAKAPGPPTSVMVVSDHGAQTLQGGVRLNQWLINEGLLVLRHPVPEGETLPLSDCEIDWSRTQAVGQGGYCGRVMLNLRGRQPTGLVAPEEAGALLDRISGGLRAIRDPATLGGSGPQAAPAPVTEVLRPGDLYRAAPRGFPPDLIIYFDALRWRALGSVGGPLFDLENDTGPDGANHAKHGVFILKDSKLRPGPRAGLILQDVFATACARLGLSPPAGTHGQVVA